MSRVVVNNFLTTLAAGIDDDDTSIQLTSVMGLPLPLGADEYIRFTIDDGTNIEIFETDNINSGTGVCSGCIRGLEGTTAASFSSGANVEIRATSEMMLTGYNLYNLLDSDDIVWPTDGDPDPDDLILGFNSNSSNLPVLMSGGNVARIFKQETDVSDSSWVNDTDDTLAVDDHLIPTNEMVKAYVDSSGGGSASDSFKTISVSGQSDVIADSPTDTLTLVAGSNVTITTNASTDTITIAASGGGGGSGDVVGPSSSVANEMAVFDGTTGKLLKSPVAAGVIMSSGDTSSRGSSNYAIRWNTDLGHAEIRNGGWTGQQLLMDSDFSNVGMVVKVDALTYSARSITGTTNYINVTNGNGLSGNPTITISPNYPGGSSIATLGVITQGTWNADAIAVNYGGTGFTSYTAGQLLYASGTSTLSKLNIGSNGNVLTVVSGVPAWADPVAVADGDKGDITVSSSGATWTIDTPASATIATDDKVLIKDTSASDVMKYVTTQAIRDLAPGSGTMTSAQLRTALTDESGTGAAYFQGGDIGTPSAGVLTNATGLPISTGVSGLGTGVATFLSTPSSANLASALTDETGTGSAVFSDTPTLTTPIIGSIKDSNSNTILSFTPVASAVNNVDIRNSAASGVYPRISAVGSDTNIGFNFVAKGTGVIQYQSANTIPFQILSGSPSLHTTNFSFANNSNTRTVTFPDATGTLLMTGVAISTVPSIAFSSTSGVIGTTTNDSAAAGSVGENITATGSAVAISNNTQTNVTSISLTAGDWLVYGVVKSNPAGTTTTTEVAGGISTTTATLPTIYAATGTAAAGIATGPSVAPVRISISSTTTVYLVARIQYAVSTCTVSGTITGIRTR